MLFIVMFHRLAGVKTSSYLQRGYGLLAVLMAVGWFALIGYILLQGAYELGGLLVIFTLLIAVLAYFNERPD